MLMFASGLMYPIFSPQWGRRGRVRHVTRSTWLSTCCRSTSIWLMKRWKPSRVTSVGLRCPPAPPWTATSVENTRRWLETSGDPPPSGHLVLLSRGGQQHAVVLIRPCRWCQRDSMSLMIWGKRQESVMRLATLSRYFMLAYHFWISAALNVFLTRFFFFLAFILCICPLCLKSEFVATNQSSLSFEFSSGLADFDHGQGRNESRQARATLSTV